MGRCMTRSPAAKDRHRGVGDVSNWPQWALRQCETQLKERVQSVEEGGFMFPWCQANFGHSSRMGMDLSQLRTIVAPSR